MKRNGRLEAERYDTEHLGYFFQNGIELKQNGVDSKRMKRNTAIFPEAERTENHFFKLKRNIREQSLYYIETKRNEINGI